MMICHYILLILKYMLNMNNLLKLPSSVHAILSIRKLLEDNILQRNESMPVNQKEVYGNDILIDNHLLEQFYQLFCITLILIDIILY